MHVCFAELLTFITKRKGGRSSSVMVLPILFVVVFNKLLRLGGQPTPKVDGGWNGQENQISGLHQGKF